MTDGPRETAGPAWRTTLAFAFGVLVVGAAAALGLADRLGDEASRSAPMVAALGCLIGILIGAVVRIPDAPRDARRMAATRRFAPLIGGAAYLVWVTAPLWGFGFMCLGTPYVVTTQLRHAFRQARAERAKGEGPLDLGKHAGP